MTAIATQGRSGIPRPPLRLRLSYMGAADPPRTWLSRRIGRDPDPNPRYRALLSSTLYWTGLILGRLRAFAQDGILARNLDVDSVLRGDVHCERVLSGVQHRVPREVDSANAAKRQAHFRICQPVGLSPAEALLSFQLIQRVWRGPMAPVH